MKTKLHGSLMALALTLGSASVNAVTLYNNLDVPTSSVAQIVNPDGSFIGVASAFNTGAFCTNGCVLGNATLNLSFSAGTNAGSGVELKLYKDDGDTTTPGTAYASFVSPNEISSGLIDQDIFTPASNLLMPGQDIILESGTNYWLELRTLGDTALSWAMSAGSHPDAGNRFIDYGEAAGLEFLLGPQRAPDSRFLFKVEAVELDVAPVPVPAAIWLMLTGLTGLAVRSRNASATLAS